MIIVKIYFFPSYMTGEAKLLLASHMRLFEGLFVVLDKCTRAPFHFWVIIILKTIIVPYVFQNVF